MSDEPPKQKIWNIVSLMSEGMSDIQLPRNTVTRPNNRVRSNLLIIGAFVLVLVGVLWITGGNSKQVIGAFIILAILYSVLVIEVVVGLRVQQRRQETQMSGLPIGGLFVGGASIYPANGGQGKPTYGSMLLDNQGLHFTSKKGLDTFEVSWPNISSMNLSPANGKIGIGMLTLSLRDGGERKFQVTAANQLADVIERYS
jgi:hypothetical protein